jgi:hypothetical protein
MSLFKTPIKAESSFCKKDLLILLLWVIAGSMIAPFLFLIGLSETTAVDASPLQNAE